MSVDIEPLELSFQRPFTVEVARTLTIKNPNSTPVAFKVKTTAPKQYCVRPNAGRIEPGQDFDVSVLLQAMKADPPADAKCRDKFLVQSALITADKEFASIASVLDTTNKSSITERKIRVTWLASEDAPAVATPSKPTTAHSTDTPEASRTFSSPSAPPPAYEDKEEEKTPLTAAALHAATTAELTYDEMKAKLAEYKAQVVALKDDSGLRQRAGKGNEVVQEKAGEVAQAVKQTVEGVPVQIVAALCLLSFLLAYFFF